MAYAYSANPADPAPVPLFFSTPPTSSTVSVGSYRYEANTLATRGSAPGAATGGPSGGGGAGSIGGVTGGGSGGRGVGTLIEVPTPAGSGTTAPLLVRTRTPDSAIPGASLFSTRPEPGSRYLIETDPRFADHRQWRSSDDLLDALGLDLLQKRLGDGFYEQRLIREQIAQLTGRRYLDGLRSDDEQYAALLNAGATFAKAYGLRPGISLSAEQMAQLTSDIVWLVEQDVTLPDGSTQKVLVPQVYVRVRPGDIDGAGALLGADALRIETDGDVSNTGTIAGRNLVAINADTINNLGGRISGGQVALDVAKDLNSFGGSIDARDSLSVEAGRDIDIRTTTTTSSNGLVSGTNIDRVAGLYVTNPAGTLVVSAGNDIHLVGAVIENKGRGGWTSITAKNDIHLGTVHESTTVAGFGSGASMSSLSARETGTTLTTDGTTILNAGRDVNARRATVDAGTGLLSLHADRDIRIDPGQQPSAGRYSMQWTDKGLLSRTDNRVSGGWDDSTSIGSRFSGGLVALEAKNDIRIEGSHIAGTQGVMIDAGRHLGIVEGRNTSSTRIDVDKKRSSAIVDPVFMQNRASGTGIDLRSDTATASTIASSRGGVLLQGGVVHLQGAQVAAAKDITIQGGEVHIAGAIHRSEVGGEQRQRGGDFGPLGLHDLGHGLGAKASDTLNAESTSLARTTLDGANVRITAAGHDGTGGDLHIAGTSVNTPGTLSLEAGTLHLETQSTVATLETANQRKDFAWQQQGARGTSDETTNYNQFNAGTMAINANRVQAGLGARDSIGQLAREPGMGWMDQLNRDPSLSAKVDWLQVEEAHRNWDYQQQGLTPEGAAIVTLAVAYFTAGTASGLGSAAATATGSTVAGGAVTAGVTALASQAGVALINNRGDIGGALNELGSSASVKRLLTAIATGGALAGLNLDPTGLPTTGGGAQPFMTQLGQNLTAGAARAVIGTAIHGGSFEDNLEEGLKGAILDTIAAQSAFTVGTRLEPGSAANALAHALAGCAVGAMRTNGSCGAGAIGAAVGELAASVYDPGATHAHGDTVKFAAMMAGLGAALAGLDAQQIHLASEAGANAAANNWLATQQRARMARELQEAKTPLEQLQVMGRWTRVSVKQDALTASGVGKGLADAGISDIQALVDFLANPVEGLNGLQRIITSPEARQQLGDSAFRELDARIDRMKTALEVGGDQNAEQLGKDLGGLIWQVGTVVTGAGAAAKGGVALANAAASLGARTLENAALQFMKLDAGVIRGFKSADEVNAMMKAADGWSPAWMPGTTVAETTIKPGTRVHMVVDETTYLNYVNDGRTDMRFGGWGTFDNVPNQAYARNELALTSGMKENVGYVIEVEVIKPINAQVGVVGSQGSAAGGGNQLHFIVPTHERSSVFRVVGERKLM